MSKKKQQDCAVTDSVSQEPTTVNKEEGKIVPQESHSEEDNIDSGKETGYERLTDECKEFIIGFAKACYDDPDCQANALRRYCALQKIEDIAKEHQKKLSQVDIIVDAVEIDHIGNKLLADFEAEHDHANERLAEIMARHVPEFQAELNQLRKKLKK